MKKKITVLLLMFCLVITTLTGCGSKVDEQKFMRAVLDASYKEEYAEFAEMTGMTESEAKIEVEKYYEEQIAIVNKGNVLSDQQKNAVNEMRRNLGKCVRCEVVGSQKITDDLYSVDIKVQRAHLLDKAFRQSWTEFLQILSASTQPGEIYLILAKNIQLVIDEGIEYDEEEIITITIDVDAGWFSTTYSIDESQRKVLMKALFDYTEFENSIYELQSQL